LKDVMQIGGRQGRGGGGGGVGREREGWKRFFTGQYIRSAKKVGGTRDGGKRRMRRSKGRQLKEEMEGMKRKEKDEKVDVHKTKRMEVGLIHYAPSCNLSLMARNHCK